MKTILRSVPNRSNKHLLEYVDIIFVDRNYRGCKSFAEQIKLMAKLDDDVLFLEDDISISSEQYDFIVKTIESNPDIIINFSSRLLKDGIYAPSTFLVTRCVYFPHRVLANIADKLSIDDFCKEPYYDIALRALMTERYLSINYKKAITDLHLKSEMKYI